MQEYELTINGLPHTFLLSEEDAKRLDARPVERKVAEPVQNKARRTRTKVDD